VSAKAAGRNDKLAISLAEAGPHQDAGMVTCLVCINVYGIGTVDATSIPSSLASLKFRMVHLSPAGRAYPGCPEKETIKRYLLFHSLTDKCRLTAECWK